MMESRQSTTNIVLLPTMRWRRTACALLLLGPALSSCPVSDAAEPGVDVDVQLRLPLGGASLELVGGALSQSGGGGLQGTIEVNTGLDMELSAGLHLVGALDPAIHPDYFPAEFPDQTLKAFGVVTTASRLGVSFRLRQSASIGPALSLDTLHFLERRPEPGMGSSSHLHLTPRYGCLESGSVGLNIVTRWMTRGPMFSGSAGVATACYDDYTLLAPRLELRVRSQQGWTYGFHMDPRSLIVRVGRGASWIVPSTTAP